MTDETRPDPLGCNHCGRVNCRKGKRGRDLGESLSWTRECADLPAVDWQRECARHVEERRKMAMEAAARVWARCSGHRDLTMAREYVAELVRGERVNIFAHLLALDVLDEFGVTARRVSRSPVELLAEHVAEHAFGIVK